MKTIPFVLSVLLVLSFGCEPVRHYNRLQAAAYAGHYPRKPYGTPQVFRAPEEIPHPYQLIGMLSCEGSSGEEAGILNAMLYRAADMGGDGILLGGPSVAAETVVQDTKTVNMNLRQDAWAGILGNPNSDHRAYRCQVIKYKE